MQVVLDIAFRASEQLRKSSVRMAGPGEGTNRVPAEYEYRMSSLKRSARWRKQSRYRPGVAQRVPGG
jgi:hypothetical protein